MRHDLASDGDGLARRFGLEPGALGRAWTVADIASYLGVGRTHAYRLMAKPDAPRRLNTGRAHRWAPVPVLEWLESLPDPAPITTEGPWAPSGARSTTPPAQAKTTPNQTVPSTSRAVVEPGRADRQARRDRAHQILRPREQ